MSILTIITILAGLLVLATIAGGVVSNIRSWYDGRSFCSFCIKKHEKGIVPKRREYSI